MNHLTEHAKSIDQWELHPDNLHIATNTNHHIPMPKILNFWQHAKTGDVVVVCDWGIDGHYELHHIPSKYIKEGNQWLKRLHLQKDKAKYSHGKRVLESERDTAETFIQKAETYLENNPEGVLNE